MSVIGIILMWVFFAAAWVIVSRWPMGRETARRQAYWDHYEGK
jgi:hypothetical protein